MNSHTVVTAKIDYLSGNSELDINDSMKKIVADDPELAQEMRFIESFWHKDNDPVDEQPSANLDVQFYRMLSQAKSAQTAVSQPERLSWWQQLQHWITPKPMMQFATLAVVFAIGYGSNNLQPQQTDESFAGLEQQVQSLSALVAMSMINKGSASERLTGITYSRQTGGRDPAVDGVLLKLLNTDRSTAVRLSAINAFSSRLSVSAIETQLLDSVLRQEQPLVQIGLIKLLAGKGSESSLSELSQMADDGRLTPEGSEFLQQLKAKNLI